MSWIRTMLLMTSAALMMESCFKDDERVMPFPGDITTIPDSVQVYASYFDLESGKVIASHPLRDWQLGFECNNEGWRIITNSGDNWFIYNTGSQVLAPHPGMPSALNGLYDIQQLWPDSTAAGKWIAIHLDSNTYSRNVYHLGKYSDGRFSLIRQVVFLEVTDSTYRFYYRDTDQSDTVTIVKKDQVNFAYYSFYRHEQVETEPDRNSYDIVFTSYYDLATLFNQTIPYQVGGVLLNVTETFAAVDSLHRFDEISLETVTGMDLSKQRDIPGYKWKNVTVDITGGGSATYDVKTHYNYIIKTMQGNYYKMRFLSYTLDGMSGHPRFEYRKLE